jgi:hypothetical protein
MTKTQNILGENVYQYPIAFLDYMFVITIYVISAFFLSVAIDGYLVPTFNQSIASQQSNFYLASKILLQLSVQGFIAIFLYALLQKIHSPFYGLYGYTSKTPLGLSIRNPAIISVILFFYSTSLHSDLYLLFSRVTGKSISNRSNATHANNVNKNCNKI